MTTMPWLNKQDKHNIRS